jgi:hypothetical protein
MIKQNTPDRIRTCDLRIRNPKANTEKPCSCAKNKDSQNPLVENLFSCVNKYPDLGLVVKRWAELPENIRAAIKALVKPQGKAEL